MERLYPMSMLSKLTGTKMTAKFAVLIHVLAGILTAASCLVSPILPIVGLGTFVAYEWKQSLEIGDIAHTALRHFAVAFFITTGLILALSPIRYGV